MKNFLEKTVFLRFFFASRFYAHKKREFLLLLVFGAASANQKPKEEENLFDVFVFCIQTWMVLLVKQFNKEQFNKERIAEKKKRKNIENQNGEMAEWSKAADC